MDDSSESFRWLRCMAPEFTMTGDNIQVITTPKEFYSTIDKKLRSATKRISIASLYLGTDHLEKQLVSSMQHALQVSKGSLPVKILLDFTRGSRGTVNSRSMLLPLLNQPLDGRRSVQVFLYHTPDLRGIMKWLMPDRFNETFGLQHMKIYVMDDEVIISGANLSNDYFTNRQDRYVLFADKTLANFFDDLIATVSLFSFQLQPDNSVTLNPEWKIHPYNGSCADFKFEAHKRIENLLDDWKCRLGSADKNNMDSRVYPLVQMGPFGVSHDSKVTTHVFTTVPQFTKIYLASGYFNLTHNYIDVILNSSLANYNILTASPRANGFFNAKGVAGSIPKVYTYISSLFYNKTISRNQQSRITLFEYEKPQWTFHAKGLWYYAPNSVLPTMTLVGSPNFGHRSVHLDLESQVAVVTKNIGLQEQLRQEQIMLFSDSSPVSAATYTSSDRYVPFWVRLFSRVFKRFF